MKDMRSKFNRSVQYTTDVPPGAIGLADRRTQPLLDFYGNHIRSITLETLIRSAYLQGVEDCFTFHEKQAVVVQNAGRVALEAGLLGLPGVSSGL